MDEEAWYSVTPEKIAEHIAQRCVPLSGNIVLVDGFCGAGGNMIQFALASDRIHVVAVDINPERLRMAKHNAAIYGVDHKIDFVNGDFIKLTASGALKADIVFLSLPWGGPEYLTKKAYSLDFMTPNGKDTVKLVQEKITQNIAFLLPRNVMTQELQELAGEGMCVEIEKNFLNGSKLKTITAYFGDLINNTTDTMATD